MGADGMWFIQKADKLKSQEELVFQFELTGHKVGRKKLISWPKHSELRTSLLLRGRSTFSLYSDLELIG